MTWPKWGRDRDRTPVFLFSDTPGETYGLIRDTHPKSNMGALLPGSGREWRIKPFSFFPRVQPPTREQRQYNRRSSLEGGSGNPYWAGMPVDVSGTSFWASFLKFLDPLAFTAFSITLTTVFLDFV